MLMTKKKVQTLYLHATSSSLHFYRRYPKSLISVILTSSNSPNLTSQLLNFPRSKTRSKTQMLFRCNSSGHHSPATQRFLIFSVLSSDLLSSDRHGSSAQLTEIP